MLVWPLEVLPKMLTKPIDFSSLGVVLLVFWPRVLLMSPPCPSTLRHMYLYTRRFPPYVYVHMYAHFDFTATNEWQFKACRSTLIWCLFELWRCCQKRSQNLLVLALWELFCLFFDPGCFWWARQAQVHLDKCTCTLADSPLMYMYICMRTSISLLHVSDNS